MKHTKGPWAVDDKKARYTFVQANGQAPCNEDATPEAQANAHLIAAAPEMLEELEQLREALNDSVLSTGSPTKDEEMLYHIRKLILKAKGGA